MSEERGVYRVLVGKPEGRRPLGRPRRRWVDNIKTDLQEVGCGYMDWIGLAQDRDRWRTLVSAVMNLRVSWIAGNFLTTCKPVSFSRRTLYHGVSKYPASMSVKKTAGILCLISGSRDENYGRVWEILLQAWRKKNIFLFKTGAALVNALANVWGRDCLSVTATRSWLLGSGFKTRRQQDILFFYTHRYRCWAPSSLLHNWYRDRPTFPNEEWRRPDDKHPHTSFSNEAN